jgi:hypothetical protein
MMGLIRTLTVMAVFFFNMPIFAQNVFSLQGNKTYLNDKEFQAIGLRCSNALLSDATVNGLIRHLDDYKTYGLNTISVYFMGSRYSNIHGYNLDGSLNHVYRERMSRIIEACDARGMVVLVGILYWGSGVSGRSNEHYSTWKQQDVNNAMSNTLIWLKEKGYRNVFIDPDNEGMAEIGAGFNIDEMICEGKKAYQSIPIAYNGRGYPPPCADMTIHFGAKTQQMPYIETEGTPGEYWGEYSKERRLNAYINVGIYTEGKKDQQLNESKELLDKGHGYLFASTWLQNIPPNYNLGGDGSPCNPGIKWWVEFIGEWRKGRRE